MPLTGGYWFSTKSFDLIEIYEHLQFLSGLEAKVRNELPLTAKESAYAAELGMEPGAGWGLVPREKPAERRERFLREAMRCGWVRIRASQSGSAWTFEASRLNEDTLSSLVLAVKKLDLWPGTPLELHGVEEDKAISLTAEDLLRYAEGEQPAAIGFSVFANPIGNPGGRIRFRQRGCRREFVAYDNPAGGFYTKHTGRFHATEGAKLYGKLQANPAVLSEFIDVDKGEGRSVGRFFLGLTRGVGNQRGREIDPEHVVAFVSQTRRRQLPSGLRGGATFVSQRGFFTNWKAHHEYPEEDSLQVLIYPEFDGGEDLISFEHNMKEMVQMLADRFDQRSVILDLEVDGEQRFLGEAKQD